MTPLENWKHKFDLYQSICKLIEETVKTNPECRSILTAALDMNGVPYNIVLHAVDGDAFQGELENYKNKATEAAALLFREEGEQAK